MADPFSILVAVTVGGAAVGIGLLVQNHQYRSFLRDLAAFDDVEAVPAGWGKIALRTTTATPGATVTAAGGGKNNPTRWDCLSLAEPLAHRTTMKIDREGALGAVREKLGKHDVHTGDVGFDRAFCLRGSDEDVVRGVLQRPAVQAAVRALFEDTEVRYVELKKDGALYAWASRSATNAHAARKKALALAALARALIDNAEVQAVAAATSPLRTAGVGGATGAPVGVPIGDRR